MLLYSQIAGRRWRSETLSEVSGDIREEVDVAGPSSHPIYSGRKKIEIIQVAQSGRRDATRNLYFFDASSAIDLIIER